MHTAGIITGSGVIYWHPTGMRLFIRTDDGHWCVGNTNRILLNPGDTVEFSAIHGDQCADVTALTRRPTP